MFMKLSTITLNLMRGSTGAFIAAAALSGVANAGSTNVNQITNATDPSLTTKSENRSANAEPPKKDEEEQPPKKEREVCEGCGRG